jgi:hypothetical protein
MVEAGRKRNRAEFQVARERLRSTTEDAAAANSNLTGYCERLMNWHYRCLSDEYHPRAVEAARLAGLSAVEPCHVADAFKKARRAGNECELSRRDWLAFNFWFDPFNAHLGDPATGSLLPFGESPKVGTSESVSDPPTLTKQQDAPEPERSILDEMLAEGNRLHIDTNMQWPDVKKQLEEKYKPYRFDSPDALRMRCFRWNRDHKEADAQNK